MSIEIEDTNRGMLGLWVTIACAAFMIGCGQQEQANRHLFPSYNIVLLLGNSYFDVDVGGWIFWLCKIL